MMFTKKKLPLLILLVCFAEIAVYLWSLWTSTFERGNFFGITPPFIFDKCARISGRVSSALFLLLLITVGYFGLKKIYSTEKLKEKFIVLITIFSFNHLIHLLFVFLRFNTHSKTIHLDGFMPFGGITHGFISFAFIVIVPIILWRFKIFNTVIYSLIIFHLLNVSSFIIKTFYDKINLPKNPAYHNQFGILAISLACVLIIYKVYIENTKLVIKK